VLPDKVVHVFGTRCSRKVEEVEEEEEGKPKPTWGLA